MDFLVRLGLNFHPMGELKGGSWREGVDWASDTFFVTDRQKCDYLSRASQCARGATKKYNIHLINLSFTYSMIYTVRHSHNFKLYIICSQHCCGWRHCCKRGCYLDLWPVADHQFLNPLPSTKYRGCSSSVDFPLFHTLTTSSHHMENTEAGLQGLCFWEIDLKLLVYNA